MKLYGVASSRTRRPLWALLEAGAQFEFRKLDLAAGEHRGAQFLAVNPNGKVPALVDGDLTLFESAAICDYVANRFPAAGLLPEPGSRELALCRQWMFWVVGELEQPLWNLAKHRFALPREWRIQRMREVAEYEWQAPAAVLARHLEGREFMVGATFTLADILVSHTLNWARGAGIALGADVSEAYLERMLARPAFQRTLEY